MKFVPPDLASDKPSISLAPVEGASSKAALPLPSEVNICPSVPSVAVYVTAPTTKASVVTVPSK